MSPAPQRTEVPGCRHERADIVDSRFHGHAYATAASRGVFCDVCRLQRWLDVEAALALTQGEMGLIPQKAADEIAAAARLELLDLDALQGEFRRTAHSLVPLLRALQGACAGDAGEFVHHGATTQDIQDTAQSLEMLEVLDEVCAGLHRIVGHLVPLAVAHRDTLMIGRTHARPALPTTFGLKVASWLDELLRHADRLDQLRPRVAVAQMFGGVGTMAGFDGRGPELLERFATRLGLGAPAAPWHVARDRVADYLGVLAMLAGTLARSADDVRTLCRPELGELEKGWHHGLVGSSTMPHKRNPEDCEQVVVMARLARAGAGLGLDAMVGEHERDGRSLRLEWKAVADVSHHTLAAFATMDRMLAGIGVNTDRMGEQARQAADLVCSEALMLALGRHIGKQSAHELVYDLSQAGQSQGCRLREVLAGRPDVTGRLAPGELEEIFDPANHLGSAGVLVDGVVASARQWLDDVAAAQ